jgi:hypothetical protein
MKWKAKMDELGLTNETISQGLKTKIKDYYTLVDGMEEARQSLEDASEDDDIDELTDDVNELEEVVEIADNNLAKGMEVFFKNKDRYAEMSKHLSKGRPRKDGQPSVPKVATPTPTPTPTPKPTPTPQVAASGVVVEEKKKSSTSWILLGGLALVVTLGAVNIFKNND